jgi:hypothetical protein
MSTTTKPWPLPHQSTDRLTNSIDWAGFVGVDNIDGIFERVKKIVVPGRSFTIIRTDSVEQWTSPRVDQGATLYMGPAYREPLECKKGEHLAATSVNMGPRVLAGFGMHADSVYDHEADGAHVMTGKEVRDRVYTDRIIGGKNYGPDRFDWCHVTINGGIDGYRPGHDRITIIRQNEHGYQEMIDVIPADIAWQQRYERDAITADQIAGLLERDDHDEYSPADGITRDEATAAAAVVRRVAVGLRTWREPLTKHEVFPVVKEMR